MNLSRIVKSLILVCAMLPLTLSAQQQGKKVFGKGKPFTIEELPAGKLKAKLQTLDPKAREKAMKWLHELTFHEFDAADHLRVDQKGGIYIVCPDGHGNCDGKNRKHHKQEYLTGEATNTVPIEADTTKPTEPPVVANAPVPISSPPAYNSKPGAPYHIYLDFNGALVSGKDWSETDDKETTDPSDDITWRSWDCAAWSTDADVSTFSDSEQEEIRRVWERIAEDYAPFNVNVTTDVAYDSVTYTGDKNKVGWLLFTNNTDKNGARCPHYGAGGVAYLGHFGESDYFSRYQPAWVLPTSTSNMAEAASHEMGHNMGLSHDGFPDPDPANTKDGNGAYYGGHAAVSGVATSWGPLMGTGYGRNVSQWSKASEYYAGNQPQDDLAIISARVPYCADDHGNTFGTATPWTSGTVNQAGVIERTNEVDVFTFLAGSGTITLNASAYKCDTGTWGGNLDTILELYDSSLNLIDSNNPADQVDSSLSVPVSAGRYYVMLRPAAAGDPLVSARSGYTEYGSLGQYTITGSYVPDNGVILSYPGGGGTWYTGSIYNITWGSVMGGNVKIELLKAGSLHTTIADSTPNDGSYAWEVPSAQASGSDYKVRITSVEDPTKTDQSLGDFSITTDPLAVALDTEGLVWTTSGNLPWFPIGATQAQDGIDAAQSGAIGHSQTSSMETTIVGPGTMTFWWRVSSELSFDFLRFYMNGVEQTGSLAKISGSVAWVQKTVIIPSGSNVVKWSYTKDAATVGNFDRAWVDQVVFTPTPVQVAVVPSNLSVPEGGSNTVAVSLSAQPSANVTVTVSRTAGDSDITVSAGSSLVFTTANWATPQNATLSAAEDVDTLGSTATIALNADLAAVTDKTITAIEVDDAVTLTVVGGTGGTVNSVGLVDPDGGPFTITATPAVGYTFTSWSTSAGTVATSTSASTTINGFTVNTTVTATFTLNTVAVVAANLSVPEGGSNTVAVSLSAQPSASVTVAVSRTAGDSDVTVSGGSSLVFTTANWATPQNATLTAAEDVDTDSSTATITLNANLAAVTDKTITATEVDDAVTLTVASGSGGTVNSVGLVDPDTGPFAITATPSVGYSFTSWSTTSGTVAAPASASTTINGFTVNTTVTATFSLNTVAVVAANLSVPEGDTNTVAVSLSAQPITSVTVAVSRTAGDSDITVSAGSSLIFTTTNWATPQNATLAAAEDVDMVSSTATITLNADLAAVIDQIITATEVDDAVTLTVAGGTGGTVNSVGLVDPDAGPFAITATPSADYTFTSWSTTAGTVAAPTNASTTISGFTVNTTVTATFSPVTYPVTYDGNGNTSGNPPALQNKIHNVALTILGNTGHLAKSGFSFTGWNTADDGSGTPYAAGGSYSSNTPLTLYAQYVSGVDGTWLPTAAGPFNWGDSANWFNGSIASGADNTAFFTPNITAAQVVNLDTPRTIGNITFTDSTSSSHNLTISGANILTLLHTTGIPTIDVTQSGRTLTISSVITGNKGLQKNGLGALTLSGANTFTGGLTLNGGSVSFIPDSINGNTISAINSSIVTSGGTYISAIDLSTAVMLDIRPSGATFTTSGAVTGAGGVILGQAGSGSTTLNFNSTDNSFSGPVEYRVTLGSGAGTLSVNSIGDAVGSGNIRFGAAGTGTGSFSFNFGGSTGAPSGPLTFNNRRFELTGTHLRTQINNNSAQNFTINTDLLVTATAAQSLTLGGTGAGINTYVGQIGDNTGDPAGVVSLTKAGNCTWVLTNAANSYTGKTIISAGTLSINSIQNAGSTTANALGTPAVGTSSIIDIANTGSLRYTGSGHSSDRPINNTTTNGGSITVNASGATGTLALSGGFTTASSSGTSTVTLTGTGLGSQSGIISNGTDTNAAALTKAGTGTWTLGGANTFTGAATAAGGGALVLDYITQDNSKLGDAAALTLGSTTALTGSSLVLNGGSHNETVGSLTLTTGQSFLSRIGGYSGKINLNALTRTASAGGTLAIAESSIATTSSTNVNGLLTGGITVGSNWAKNDGTGNIVALAPADYTALPTDNNATTATVNYQLTGSLTRTAAASVNSLRIVGDGADQVLNMGTFDLKPSPLTVTMGNGAAGGILYAGGGNDNYTINGTGNLQAQNNTQELIIHTQQGTLNVGMKLTMGTQGLTKSGAGTLVLTSASASTYTGATRVNQGNLQVNGTLAASTVTVHPGASLGGSGTLGGNTNVLDYGGLAFHISTAAGSHDKLELAATKILTFSGASSLTITGTAAAEPGSYILLTAPGGIVGDVPATLNLPVGWAATVSKVGNDLVLNVTAVTAGPLASFTIAGIAAQVPVGSPITGITITAKDDANQTVTSFTGTVTFGGTAGITGTSANFVAGVLSGVSVTPTNVGTGRTFTVNDGASHTGTASFDVQTVFANWSGGTLATADSNNDGVANGLAWLFGAANPSVNATSLLPTFDNTTDADYFIYTYRRSDAAFYAAGTIIAVEYSSTLTSWIPAVDDGTNIIITPTNDSYGAGVAKVEVKIKKTLANGGKLFSRISLSSN